MPVDRTLAEDLARNLVDLYSNLEQQIVASIARELRTGIKTPDWAADKLASINDLRNSIQRLIQKLERDETGVVEQTITLAFARGGVAAFDELAKAGYLTATQVDAVRQSLPGAEAINRLVWTLTSTLRGTHLRVLRWAEDAYRSVIAATLPQVLSGTTTRLAAAQHAWDRLVSQGITGFVDRAGRRWQLSSYVEMAVRTGTAQAAVEGHMDRLAALGVDLVIVSDAVQECARCRPWEGKVLSRTGAHQRGLVTVPHATLDDHKVTFHLAGTVAEAIAAGLLHPNCRHSLSAYLPGITKNPNPQSTPDPKGDKARQQQRALERRIRKAKTEVAGALDPAQTRVLERKVRDAQAALREHLKEHPELKRLRYREQIGAGNIPPQRQGGQAPKPPTSTPTPAVVQPPLPEPSPSYRIAQLITQEPIETRQLSGGATARTDLVTYPDGTKLVHKVNGRGISDSREARTLTDAEQLGALVLEAVGLRAPAMHRSGPGEVYMEFIDGTLGAEFVEGTFDDAPQHVIDSDDGRLLGLADVLMSNTDRNPGNWILTPGGLVGIDHGFAFERPISRSAFARYLVDYTDDGERKLGSNNDYTPADMAKLRERLDAMRPQFEALKRDAWWKSMMSRLAALERGAQGTRDRIR